MKDDEDRKKNQINEQEKDAGWQIQSGKVGSPAFRPQGAVRMCVYLFIRLRCFGGLEAEAPSCSLKLPLSFPSAPGKVLSPSTRTNNTIPGSSYCLLVPTGASHYFLLHSGSSKKEKFSSLESQ